MAIEQDKLNLLLQLVDERIEKTSDFLALTTLDALKDALVKETDGPGVERSVTRIVEPNGAKPRTYTRSGFPEKPRRDYMEAVAMLGDNATPAEVAHHCNLLPRIVGVIRTNYAGDIETLKGLEPGDERFAYLQKRFGIGLSEGERI